MQKEKAIRVIWKFPLEIKDEIAIEMPAYSVPVAVGVQDGKPMVWCMVEPEAERVMEVFYIHGTGHDFNTLDRVYVGTFQLGAFVGHVFITAH